MTPAACNASATSSTDYAMPALPVFPPIRQAAKWSAERFAGSREPSLDELLDDPIVARLMASDRIAMDDLLALVGDVRKALARR
jgi:hypothetical protein